MASCIATNCLSNLLLFLFMYVIRSYIEDEDDYDRIGMSHES